MRGALGDQTLIYLQIAQLLEDDILRGVYREEEQVPSTNELSRCYNINPATAAKGINLLVADGILYKRRGIGMFVSPGGVEKVRKKRKAAFCQGYIQPMIDEGRSLSPVSYTHLAGQARAPGQACGGPLLRLYYPRRLRGGLRPCLLYTSLAHLEEYQDCFLSAQEALLLADNRSLVVVVDTNRPEQVQSLDLVQSCNRVAVIDHHRRAATYIEGAALNYHEPYASSASELVTELLQYICLLYTSSAEMRRSSTS